MLNKHVPSSLTFQSPLRSQRRRTHPGVGAKGFVIKGRVSTRPESFVWTGGTYLFPPLYSGGNKSGSSLLHKKNDCKRVGLWNTKPTKILGSLQPGNHLYLLHARCDLGLLINYYKGIKSPGSQMCRMSYCSKQFQRIRDSHNESQWVTNTYNDLKMCHIKSQPTHALWDMNEKHKSSR